MGVVIRLKQKRNKMAEEKSNTNITSQAMLSDDDISALEHVLQYIKGASPSSITPLELEMLSDE